MVIRRVIRKFKAAQPPMIRFIQRVILRGCLFLLYYTGFGLSRLVMTFLARGTLYNKPRPRLGKDTYWREAMGYELDEARLTRQS